MESDRGKLLMSFSRLCLHKQGYTHVHMPHSCATGNKKINYKNTPTASLPLVLFRNLSSLAASTSSINQRDCFLFLAAEH